MALRTNSKRAAENVRKYIIENYTGDNYDNAPEDTAPFNEIAGFVLSIFEEEYCNPWNMKHNNKAELFINYAAGLPSILDTCYFYNRSAVDDLGAILEETEAEKARFTEAESERLLSILIYRELEKGARANK